MHLATKLISLLCTLTVLYSLDTIYTHMRKEYTHKGLTWIDLESPTKSEIREIMEEYSIHPLVAEELVAPTLRPKVDLYDNAIYLILHFPAHRHTNSSGQNQEIDFIIGKDFLITAHYDTVDALHKFQKIFEANSITNEKHLGEHAGFIFYYLIKKLYKSVDHELEYTESYMDEIEENIFQGQEKEMVEDISSIARILLDFKQALRTHDSVLSSLEIAGVKFFGNSFLHYLKRITGEHYRVQSAVEDQQEALRELRETNNSLLSTKQNEVMKVLTIMAFVTFPLSLLASIFGMNTTTLPIVGHRFDFWIVIGIMCTLTVIFFIFFKKNRFL